MFENSSKIVIVMEYASKGDLYDYISERQRLSEQEARHFFRQVVSAVYYCHKVGWHRASRRFPADFPALSRCSPGGRAAGWAPECSALQQRAGEGCSPAGGETSWWLCTFPTRRVDPAFV